MITKAVPARAHTRTFAIGVDYISEHTHQRDNADQSGRYICRDQDYVAVYLTKHHRRDPRASKSASPDLERLRTDPRRCSSACSSNGRLTDSAKLAGIRRD